MAGGIEENIDLRGTSVADCILNGFLGNAEKVRGRLGLELHEGAEDFHRALNLMKDSGGLREVAQSPSQIAIFQLEGSEPARDEAGVVNGTMNALGDELELVAETGRSAGEFFGNLEGEMQGGQLLADSIMKIVADSLMLPLGNHQEIALEFPVSGDLESGDSASRRTAINNQRSAGSGRSGLGFHVAGGR